MKFELNVAKYVAQLGRVAIKDKSGEETEMQ